MTRNFHRLLLSTFTANIVFGLSLTQLHAAEVNTITHCEITTAIAPTVPIKKRASINNSLVNSAINSPKNTPSHDDPAIYLLADNIVSTQSNQFEVSGNVSIKTNKQSIEANQAQYNRQQHYLSAQGHITYQEKSLLIKSDSLNLDLKSNSGQAKNTRYFLLEQNTNGIAEELSFQNNQLTLKESTYSTCVETTKPKAWQIRAKSIELYPERNEGIARNMRLEIADVPVLYLPYISFPIKGRKSGFLAPRPSYSSNKGFDVAVPYYFNLRTNYDLTFTPRFINKRGMQAAGEFRYLEKKSQGTIGVEILPTDKQTQTDRAQLFFQHRSQITDSTRYTLEYAQVSDKRYFTDLGTQLNAVNKSRLSRQFQSESHSRNLSRNLSSNANTASTSSGANMTSKNHQNQSYSWLFSTIVQDYQVLDNNPAPYRRLPQLNLNMMGGFNTRIGKLQWRNYSQYTYFQKNSNDYVHRALVSPQISLPVMRQYGYFTPSVGLRGTYFQPSSNNNDNNAQTRYTNWQFETEAGLFFEKTVEDDFNGNPNQSAIQTLTPEIKYTYRPYKSQTNLPLLDSGLMNYDINQLFTDNRYSGYDRQGDENRISWSLSTDYILANANSAIFSAQLTQALYLADHKVLLNQEKAIKKNDIVNTAMMKGRLTPSLSAKAQAYHFVGETRLNNANMSLNYEKKHEQVELAYRYRDQLVEQVSLIGILDISTKWRVATRWLYSINDKRTREALLGLEYNSCCWAVRLMGRQYASRTSNELSTSVGLQIELKGLTSIGSSLDKQFSDEVFGNQ